MNKPNAIIGVPNYFNVFEDQNVNPLTQKLFANGFITINDPDAGQGSFSTQVVPQKGTLGILTLKPNGEYSYSVDNKLVQYLGANDTKIEYFTIKSVDGTTKVVSFNIHGTNDAAVIGNPSNAVLTEDKNVILGYTTAVGSIGIKDADSGQSNFKLAVGSDPANLGKLVLAKDGTYVYAVNNKAIQYLGANDTKVEHFTVTSADGTQKVVDFTIKGVNDAAVISNPIGSFAVSEDKNINNQGYLTATGSVAISDLDQGQSGFAPVINAQGNLGALTLTYSGQGNIYNYEYKVDNSLAGVQALNDNQSLTDNFTLKSLDGTATKNISFNINGQTDITNINDAPTGANHTATVLEDGTYTFQSSDFGFSDAKDTPANALKSVMVTSLPSNGSLSLNGVAVTANMAISAQDINAGNLKFTPATNANGDNYANFEFKVQDDGGTANGGVDTSVSPNTMTLNVTPVNDAPVGANHTATLLEDGTYTFQNGDFGFSDPNDPQANALQSIMITSLPSNGSLSLNGVAVTANMAISAQDINAGNLKFTPATNANGDNYANFEFKVQDDGGTANGGVDISVSPNTMTLNVTPVNDAPVISNPVSTLISDEDKAFIFSAANFSFSDPNDLSGNALQAIEITSLPGQGSLTLDGASVAAGQFISMNDINAGKLIFTPGSNENGDNYASFDYKVQDDGGTANGGVDLSSGTGSINFNITPVADPLFSINNDTVDFNDDLFAASYEAGTQYDALAGDDKVILPNDISTAQQAGYDPSQTFFGGDGNDQITGGRLSDKIDGGAGNDTINGGAGVTVDTLAGGDGSDTLSYTSLTSTSSGSGSTGVTVNLANQSASGAGGADIISGFENVEGSQFNDTLTGDSGTNIVLGGMGNDIIDGGDGNVTDLLNGNPGIDTLSYASLTSGVGGGTTGVTVNLSNSSVSGAGGVDAISNFENITGSQFNDVLLGDSGVNVIDGGVGNDTIDGGDGNISDDLRGGAGTDTLSYETLTSGEGGNTIGVTVNLANSLVSGAGGNDTISGFENITGSKFNDTLTGNSGDNVLNGGAGADTIDGGDGNDNIIGGTGNDVLYGGVGEDRIDGGDGNDIIEGGLGNDTLIGGLGIDTVSYASLTTGVSVIFDAGGGGNANSGIGGSDVLVNLIGSFENITGSQFNDFLVGNDDVNVIDGGAGDDRISGNLGNDTLIGGTGIDTLDYSALAAGVGQTVNLANSTSSGGAGIDTISGFENIIGSQLGDGLTGDAGNNTIDGGAGNDVIRGGLGNDTLIGGTGIDIVDYSALAAGTSQTVNLATSTASGGAGTDTISGFENITGSQLGDNLTGDAGNNTIDGGAGNDTIRGGLGNDFLIGGAGIDTLDYTDLVTGATGQTVNLGTAASSGGAGTDTISGFENITGSQFSDNLTGSSGDNVMDGGVGNIADTLNGGLGNDTLSYASLTTSGSGGAGVTVDLVGGVLGPTASGAGGADTISGFENVSGSQFNDTLIGDGNNNTLSGGAGNDTLSGGAGTDTLSGGAGTDAFTFSSTDSVEGGYDTVTDMSTTDHDTVAVQGYADSSQLQLSATTANQMMLRDTAGNNISQVNLADSTVTQGETLTFDEYNARVGYDAFHVV